MYWPKPKKTEGKGNMQNTTHKEFCLILDIFILLETEGGVEETNYITLHYITEAAEEVGRKGTNERLWKRGSKQIVKTKSQIVKVRITGDGIELLQLA